MTCVFIGSSFLCNPTWKTIKSRAFSWDDRTRATCEKCQVLIAVADANEIEPGNYYTKLNFDNPIEITSFRRAIEWLMRNAEESTPTKAAAILPVDDRPPARDGTHVVLTYADGAPLLCGDPGRASSAILLANVKAGSMPRLPPELFCEQCRMLLLVAEANHIPLDSNILDALKLVLK